jgi:hypothetical protein
LSVIVTAVSEPFAARTTTGSAGFRGAVVSPAMLTSGPLAEGEVGDDVVVAIVSAARPRLTAMAVASAVVAHCLVAHCLIVHCLVGLLRDRIPVLRPVVPALLLLELPGLGAQDAQRLADRAGGVGQYARPRLSANARGGCRVCVACAGSAIRGEIRGVGHAVDLRPEQLRGVESA